MIFYIIFAIIILSILFLFKYLSLNKRFFLAISVLLSISIFRFDVGHDYPAYYHIIYPYLDEPAIDSLEPLSRLIFLLAYHLNYPELVFIIFGLITYGCIFYTIYKISIDKAVSFIIYLFIFWLISLGEIRQALAISITFLGFRFVREKLFFKYLLTIILAYGFHSSAFISIFVYFLYNYNKSLWILPLLVIALIIKDFVVDFFVANNIYVFYFSDILELKGGEIMKYFYIFFFILIFLLHLFSKDTSNHEERKRLLRIIVVPIFFPFIFEPLLGIRSAHYYNIYYCLLIPYIVKKYRWNIKFLMVVLLFLYFCLNIYIGSLNQRSSYTPYQMIFFRENIKFRF